MKVSTKTRLRAVFFAGPLLLLASTIALADGTSSPYVGHSIVNKYEAQIARGYGECLEEVLVRVSGDQRVLDDPRLAGLKADAQSMSSGLRFHDRMEGIPLHDEQGTRDRPFDMYVTFDPKHIDDTLRTLGTRPWTGPRPRLAAFIGMRDMRGQTFVLAQDGARGIDQRDALGAAAKKFFIDVVLPSQSAIGEKHVDYARLTSRKPMPLDATPQGDVPLVGTMQWSDKPPGWVAQWHVTWQGKTTAWHTRSDNFDKAFRMGILGAEQILSGNGIPKSF